MSNGSDDNFDQRKEKQEEFLESIGYYERREQESKKIIPKHVKKIAFIDNILSKDDTNNFVEKRRLDRNKLVLDGLKGNSVYTYRGLNEKNVETLLDDLHEAYFKLIITHIPYNKEKVRAAQDYYKTFPREIYLEMENRLIFEQYEDSLNLIRKMEDKSAGIPILAYTGASEKNLTDKTLREYGAKHIFRRSGDRYEIQALDYILKTIESLK